MVRLLPPPPLLSLNGPTTKKKIAAPLKKIRSSNIRTMVLILDGNSEHIAHARRKIGRKKIRFVRGVKPGLKLTLVAD